MRSFQPLSRVVVSLVITVMGAALAGTVLLVWLGWLATGDDPRKDPFASWVAVEMAPAAGVAPGAADVVSCIEGTFPGAVTEVQPRNGSVWRVEVWVPRVRHAERTVADCAREAGFRVRTVSFGLNFWTVLIEPDSALNRLGGLLAGFVMGALFAFPFMLLAVAWYRMGTEQLRALLKPSPRLLGLGAASGLGLVLVSALLSVILPLLGISVRDQAWVEAVLALSGGSWRVMFAAILVFAIPLGEELFFRGYTFRLLLRDNGRATAYIVSSVLFAAVHFHPAGLVFYLLFGIILAWLTERTGRVVSSVMAHAVINAAAVFLMLSRLG